MPWTLDILCPGYGKLAGSYLKHYLLQTNLSSFLSPPLRLEEGMRFGWLDTCYALPFQKASKLFICLFFTNSSSINNWWDFPDGPVVKNSPCNAGTWV